MYSWLTGGKSSTTSNVSAFESVAGNVYYQFAKSGSWAKDLWDDLIAPYFKSAINVETWRNGAGGRMSRYICNNVFAYACLHILASYNIYSLYIYL